MTDKQQEIIKTLERVWKKSPELRFGQLIEDVVPTDEQLYYMHNNYFLRKLKEFEEKLDTTERWQSG